MKKAFRPLLLALLCAAIPLAAQAAKPGPDAGDKPGGTLESRMLREFASLNLSQEQKQAVAAVLKATRDEGRKLVDETNAAQHALMTAIFKDPGNTAEIQRAHKAVTVVGEKSFLHSAKVTAMIRAVLTPEQIAKLEKDYAAGKARMEERARKSRAALEAWIDQNGK